MIFDITFILQEYRGQDERMSGCICAKKYEALEREIKNLWKDNKDLRECIERLQETKIPEYQVSMPHQVGTRNPWLGVGHSDD